MTDLVTPQPKQNQNVMVSVRGHYVEDGLPCTLLAVPEPGGTWMIHTIYRPGAVRLHEEEAVRMARAILDLTGAAEGTARGIRE